MKIKGMHCASCVSLVQLELEEKGFGGNIESIEIAEENIGMLTLKNTHESDNEKITKIIESMDDYSIVKISE